MGARNCPTDPVRWHLLTQTHSALRSAGLLRLLMLLSFLFLFVLLLLLFGFSPCGGATRHSKLKWF